MIIQINTKLSKAHKVYNGLAYWRNSDDEAAPGNRDILLEVPASAAAAAFSVFSPNKLEEVLL